MPDLFPYQHTGARWLADGSSGAGGVKLLADEMGLGKSAQSVSAADLLNAGRVNVVCPAVMVADWCETFDRFGNLPRGVFAAGAKRRSSAEPEVLVASYERAQQPDVAAAIRRRGGPLVLDEAHYLKDPDSKRSEGILECLSRSASTVFALTGTPVPNHAGELFPIFRRAGLFRGSYSQFLARYCVTRQTDYGFQVLGHRNVEELRRLLAQLMLRRTSQITLPPTDRRDVEIDLSECDTKSAAFQELRRIAPSAAARVSHAVRSGSLKGFEDSEISTVRRLIGCVKAAPAARRIAKVLDHGLTNKIVVFFLHLDALAMVAGALAPYGVVQFTGETKRAHVPLNARQFQTDPSTRVALCQMRAAGVGLTLTAANWLAVVERPWSPADEDQAVRRIIRIGQKRPTFVRTLTLSDSLDEAVNGVSARKAQLIEEILAN